MFEVLLQADRALASGALDQAERSYWQLVELDPTNAIAIAGLARVSLERGDKRLARTFAERALGLDPDSVAAKRILETLAGGTGEAAPSDRPDLPLLAAQRLEALGRRRAAAGESGDQPATQPEPKARGRSGPADAAAAATEAPSRSQAAARPKTHQALGERARRHLNPDDLRQQPRTVDPFAAAESAAAIEAVDETDDLAIEEPIGPARRAGSALPRPADELDEAIGAVDEGESIAMRVALVPDAAQLQAAQLQAPELGAAELGEAELEAAAPATAELASEQIAEAGFEATKNGVSGAPAAPAALPLPPPPTPGEATEEDAEAAALREALALVLGGDGGDNPTADEGAAPAHSPAAARPTAPAEAGTASSTPARPPIPDERPAPDPSGGTGEIADSQDQSRPSRRGLFRRFRGE
ncbi:MAG: tetratricopeptide repeat protein [Candidatus Limnocylindrales bacterium]|jgi:tetratricopeptide (TPR) repeat protein